MKALYDYDRKEINVLREASEEIVELIVKKGLSYEAAREVLRDAQAKLERFPLVNPYSPDVQGSHGSDK